MYGRRQPASDRLYVERLLAVARVVMCVACLVPVSTGALTTLTYGRAVSALVVAYTVFSLVFLALVRFAPALPFRIGIATHIGDFAWASALTLLTGGASGSFFVLFLFVLLSTAFRCGLAATLLTGAGAIAVMAAYGVAAGTLAVDPFVVRGTFIGVAAVLAGVLGENERERREQLAVIGNLLAGVQAQPGFRLALRYLADALLRLTGSDVLLVSARELDSRRTALWTATRARSGATLLTSSELAEDRRRLYFFDAAGEAWSIVRRRRDTCTVTAIDRAGDVIRAADCDLEGRFWQFHQHRAALVVGIGFGSAWRGRVYLLRDRRYTLAELQFVHRALGQLVPAMHNQYLVRRLRAHTGTVERRRVARELRDGVIQSLVGLEEQTAALRRRIGQRDPEVDAQLQSLQQALGHEANAVRDVLQQIRPFDAGPGLFVPLLEEIVGRFGRETGLDARFYSAPHDLYVPPRAARELARTLQEALVNVRRHSGARRVEVEFRADAEAWRLDVENDGRPFGFLGRLALEELEARRLGPRGLKERVREMGGDMVIESSETAGVRLEISLTKPEGQSKSA